MANILQLDPHHGGKDTHPKECDLFFIFTFFHNLWKEDYFYSGVVFLFCFAALATGLSVNHRNL